MRRRTLFGESGDDLHRYLTITALEDCAVSFTVPVTNSTTSGPNVSRVSYSVDGGKNWTTGDVNTANLSKTVNLRQGESVMWKGSAYRYGSSTDCCKFSMTGKAEVHGNIMSMIYDSQFRGKTTFKEFSSYVFKQFFMGCPITTAPVLPATEVPLDGYENMFNGCSYLTESPELPATKLENGCYNRMFYGTNVGMPDFSNINFKDENFNAGIMKGLFAGTPVTYEDLKRMLPLDGDGEPTFPWALEEYCYANTFYGCTALTKGPSLPQTTVKQGCYSGMFRDCTALTTAPVLPAKNLEINCYSSMFYGCSSLNHIEAAMRSTVANNTRNWVSGVSPTGTFVKDTNATLTITGVNGVPAGWTVTSKTF